MYEKFNQYYESKKELFEKIGVSKDAAELIFFDAVQIAENESDSTILLNLHLKNQN